VLESDIVALDVEHFSAGGFAWKARRGLRPAVDALCRAAEDPGRIAGSVPIKASLGRSVWRMDLAGQRVYVKRYRVRGLREQLKYWIVPGRAEAEWRAAVALAEAGIEAALPLAVGVARRGLWLRDAFFVAAEAPGEPYVALLEALRARREDVTPLLRATVELHERLRAAGILHPDLHGGNMLARLEDGVPRIALVDLHSIRFPRFAARRPRPRMRGKLAHALWRVLRADEFERALQMLAPGEEEDVRDQVRRIERVRLRSRSRRCVLASTRFARDRAGEWTIWRRREVAGDALLALAAESRGTSRSVGQLAIGEETREVFVRWRRRPGWLPIWKRLHALSVREIPTWTGVACMHRRRFGWLREALLVVERLPDVVPLARAAGAPPDEALQRAALDAAAQLHRAGLPARAEDLYAWRDGTQWRVLQGFFHGGIPDRPRREARAAEERAALIALTAPAQAPTASR